MMSALNPAPIRSETRSLGDRLRDRLRISSWCLRSTDSATTERAPPGPASRATAARRCRTRTAKSLTAHRSKIATSQKLHANLQFATDKDQPIRLGQFGKRVVARTELSRIVAVRQSSLGDGLIKARRQTAAAVPPEQDLGNSRLLAREFNCRL